MGDPPKSGDRYGAPGALFEAREGGFDKDGVGRHPGPGTPPPHPPDGGEALRAWEATLRV